MDRSHSHVTGNGTDNRPVAVDLFCGCGAVTEGLVRSDFRVAAAVDNDPLACASYTLNHPDVHLYPLAIQQVNPRDIRKTDLGDRDLDLLVVCAPCQPFSSQNRKQENDERAPLIFQGIRFAEALRPRIIFFENVPWLASSRNSTILSKLRRGLADLGYSFGKPLRVDAADYGVPQRRLRCIMLAARDGEVPELPSAITPKGARVTVKEKIGDLRPLAAGEADPHDPLHFARRHLPIALERMRHIPKDGGSRFSLPSELELPCHRGHKGHPDVYGRMCWNDVAPTLTTGCTDITRGRFMHPRDDRAISLREAARLQTFDDGYHFAGCPGDVARQIGNAVPVRLVEKLAPALLPR